MIYDRTAADVANALRIRAEVLQAGGLPTDAQVATLNKGFITYVTLNRIEGKENELKTLLNGLFYFVQDFQNKSWTTADIFDETELPRIIENTVKLRDAFYVRDDTPDTPTAIYYFENINAIEKILNDIDELINNMRTHFRECGTFESGD